MATVHRGEDMLLRREVAIKLLHVHLARHEQVRARFLREARAAAGLDHPGILRIHDVGAGEGEEPPFLVMELLRGRTLKAFLDESGPPLAELAALVGASLARALEVAHRAGVIHRDIKPANVMVTDAGRLVVCDFGLARVDDDALATQSGETLGTPAFMSPEQALGRRVDVRSDVYSLGATVYQLATGTLPFSGSSAAVLQKVLRGDLDPPLARNAGVGPELQTVILKAMAREPDGRYPTAAALGAALDEVVAPAGLAPGDLVDYFADPGGYNARALPRVLGITLERARAAVGAGRKARALALTERVLALDPSSSGAGALAASLGVGAGHRRRATRLAAVASALAVGGLGFVAWRELGRGSPAGPDAAAGSGPVPAVVWPGAADAGAALLRAALPGAAAPALLPDAAVVAAPAPPPRPVHVPADAAVHHRPLVPVAATPAPDASVAAVAPAPRPLAPATLEVIIRPWCDVQIDGALRGRSPTRAPLELSPGHHSLVCAQPGVGRTWSGELDLAPGEHQVVRAELYADVAVKVALSGGQATIDGKVVRAGITVSLSPGPHEVEILTADEHLGPTFVHIPTHDCELRTRPELSCYEAR